MMSSCRLDLTKCPTRLQQLHPEPRPDIGITQGDCVRTALAMILGMDAPEDVPHFELWDGFGGWLAERGCHLVWFPLPCKTPECVADHLPGYLRECPALLTGTTKEGHRHTVAIIKGVAVDTVDWSEGFPLAQPDSDGFYWIGIVVPLRGFPTPEMRVQP